MYGCDSRIRFRFNYKRIMQLSCIRNPAPEVPEQNIRADKTAFFPLMKG